jgi:hypothetical protein
MNSNSQYAKFDSKTKEEFFDFALSTTCLYLNSLA